jgi:hypothetical protein
MTELENFNVRCQDYYISCHGKTVGTFELPYNVRIVMLCAEDVMTACPQNELRIFSSINEPFGPQLENLNLKYNLTETQGISQENYKLCVFSPNFNSEYLIRNKILLPKYQRQFDASIPLSKLCPDLELSDEHITFRTGVFNVPFDFNRIYINDHFSTRSGHLIKAGTIEKIDFSEVFARKGIEKQHGTRPINRLEKLLVKPIPSYYSKQYGLSAISEVQDFIRDNRHRIDSSLENVLSLNSIVVPNTDKYTPLQLFPINTRGHYLLSTIVQELSLKHPNDLVTIMIATCRKNDGRKSSVGIDLQNFYIDITIKSILIKDTAILLKTNNVADYKNKTFSEFDFDIFKYILWKRQNSYREKYLKYKKKYLELVKKTENN